MSGTIAQLADALNARGWMLSTAESCTGGMIAAACTSLAGSSDWFDCGFVTYSNEAKVAMLGVQQELLDANGAVSEQVARAMAFGAVRHSRARVSVSVTGIAGPTGGSPTKPIGTVWFGFMVDGRLYSERMQFDGDRAAVRAATMQHAIDRVIAILASPDTE